jgi:hypothetical protein
MSVTFASFPTSAPAQVAAKQIKLTENQIEGFIAAQDDMLAVVKKWVRHFRTTPTPSTMQAQTDPGGGTCTFCPDIYAEWIVVQFKPTDQVGYTVFAPDFEKVEDRSRKSAS